jgi:hypothetical protein
VTPSPATSVAAGDRGGRHARITRAAASQRVETSFLVDVEVVQQPELVVPLPVTF